jgi:hypothetical protein
MVELHESCKGAPHHCMRPSHLYHDSHNASNHHVLPVGGATTLPVPQPRPTQLPLSELAVMSAMCDAQGMKVSKPFEIVFFENYMHVGFGFGKIHGIRCTWPSLHPRSLLP